MPSMEEKRALLKSLMAQQESGQDEEGFYDLSQASPERFSSLESASLGALQSGSLGFADEIEAGVRAPFSEKSYEDIRNEVRGRYDAAKQEDPRAYLGGSLLGGAATTFIPGLNVARGASALAAAGKMAGIGAIQGLGESKDLASMDTLKDMGAGALIGGTIGGATQAILPGARSASQGLRESAEYASAKSLGMGKGEIMRMGPDKFRKIGKEALESGVIQPVTSREAMLHTAKVVRDDAGKVIGTAIESAQRAGGEAGRNVANVLDPSNIYDDVYRSLIADADLGPIARDEGKRAVEYLEKAAFDNRLEPFSFRHLQTLKNEIRGFADWSSRNADDVKTGVWNKLYDIIRQKENAAIEAASASADLPVSGQAFQGLKSSYGAKTAVTEALEKKVAGDMANRAVAPSTYGTGLIGMTMAGPKGAILGALNQLGLTFGRQTQAWGLNKMAGLIEKSPLLDKYIVPLSSAAAKGGSTLTATHYVLFNSDPEYRKAFLESEESK